MEIKGLKIERVQGSVTFGDQFGFSDQLKDFAKRLQDALYTRVRDMQSDARLDFSIRGSEKEPLLAVVCREPDFLLQVTKDAMAFRFDDVFDYNALVPPILQTYYETGFEFFQIEFFLSSGVEFLNIFDFLPGTRNSELIIDKITTTLKTPPRLLSPFGDIEHIYRLDFYTSFKWKDKNVVLKVEAPANDENTTLWCSIDVNSDKAKLQRQEVLDFSQPYQCYTQEYASFVGNLMAGWESRLDLAKRRLVPTRRT